MAVFSSTTNTTRHKEGDITGDGGIEKSPRAETSHWMTDMRYVNRQIYGNKTRVHAS